MATEKVQEFRDGVLVNEYDITIPDEVANERTLRSQAATALQNNRDFIAITSPSNAQVVAQVKALSRQVNALIRLELKELGGTN